MQVGLQQAAHLAAISVHTRTLGVWPSVPSPDGVAWLNCSSTPCQPQQADQVKPCCCCDLCRSWQHSTPQLLCCCWQQMRLICMGLEDALFTAAPAC